MVRDANGTSSKRNYSGSEFVFDCMILDSYPISTCLDLT